VTIESAPHAAAPPNSGAPRQSASSVALVRARALSKRREGRLRFALLINLVIFLLQVVFGIVGHSLGLIADAAHNLTDVVAVFASIVAVRWARRRPTSQRTFGFHRATILAAQANAASILVVTAFIVYEGARRLVHPEKVHGAIVVIVAAIAAVSNLLAALLLRETGHGHRGHDHGNNAHEHDEHDHEHHDHEDHGRKPHEVMDVDGPDMEDKRADHAASEFASTVEPVADLNMRSAMLHLLGDAVASVGVLIAGLVILLTNRFYWLDPLASIGIGVLIGFHAWKLLRQTAEVLLESTPDGIDPNEVTKSIASVSGVEDVHDLHVWSLSSDVRALSVHVVVHGQPSLEEAQLVGNAVKERVRQRYSIAHATVELEGENCSPAGEWCAIDEQ
jgi:cobalt-zinc-cadmium efflux system protein